MKTEQEVKEMLSELRWQRAQCTIKVSGAEATKLNLKIKVVEWVLGDD